jgi:hypothetical protein
MSDHKFERLVSEIRNEHIDDQVVAQAGERVWSSMAGSSTADLSLRKLRNCQDFQTLIPAYLDKSLPEARCGHRGKQVGALHCRRSGSPEVFRRGAGRWSQRRLFWLDLRRWR